MISQAHKLRKLIFRSQPCRQITALCLVERHTWQSLGAARLLSSRSQAAAPRSHSDDSQDVKRGDLHDPCNTTISLAHPTFTVWGANTGEVPLA